MVEEALEFASADGVLEFSYGLGLDLPDAFAGNLEDSADFFEGICVAVADAVAEFDDFAFAIRQCLEDQLNSFF